MAFIDAAKTRYTPEWWLVTLAKALDDRNKNLTTLQDYYDGKHPLAFASPRFREAFGGLFKAFADNFCPLVVDAVEERLSVEGFRWGSPSRGKTTGLQEADSDAWRIWQTNQLDGESQKAHTTALIKTESAAIVWSNPDDDTTPLITIEDPTQVIVAYAAGTRLSRRAALKRWLDDDGHLWANVYLPDAIYKYRSNEPYRTNATTTATLRWSGRETEGEAWPLPNPLKVVPVINLVNRPNLWHQGTSELSQVIPAQDAINKLAADMLVASEFAAYRQRYALNLELEIDEATGRPKAPFNMGVDRLLVVPPPDQPDQWTPPVTLGEFDVSDLQPYVKAIEMWVQHIATRTRTPAHYLLGQSGAFPSGESLKATETGLVAKVKRGQKHFGEGWEEVMRLGFLVLDDPKGKVVDAETIWRDPESRTESEHVDALLKLKSLGIPDEQLWEDAGYTPVQIARFRRISASKALTAALPPPAPFGSQPTPFAPRPVPTVVPPVPDAQPA